MKIAPCLPGGDLLKVRQRTSGVPLLSGAGPIRGLIFFVVLIFSRIPLFGHLGRIALRPVVKVGHATLVSEDAAELLEAELIFFVVDVSVSEAVGEVVGVLVVDVVRVKTPNRVFCTVESKSGVFI